MLGPTAQASKVWYHEFFLPAVRKITSEKVLLLMDNAGSHNSDEIDNRSQVRILCLPPNCTSVHQSLDMGIILSIKVKYRFDVLSRRTDTFEERHALQLAKLHWINGTKGLDEGHHAHILDACEIIKEFCDAASEETIGKCWLKASTLSPGNERYIRDKFNVKVPQHELNPRYEVNDLINKMVRLGFSKVLDNDELVHRHSSIRDWVFLEDMPEVTESLNNEVIEYMEINDGIFKSLEIQDGLAAPGHHSVDDGAQLPTQDTLTSILQIFEFFCNIQEKAVRCGLMEASRGLRNAKQAFVRELSLRKAPSHQTVIRDFFLPKR